MSPNKPHQPSTPPDETTKIASVYLAIGNWISAHALKLSIWTLVLMTVGGFAYAPVKSAMDARSASKAAAEAKNANLEGQVKTLEERIARAEATAALVNARFTAIDTKLTTIDDRLWRIMEHLGVREDRAIGMAKDSTKP